ncbi:MAG: hypothetical protein JW727_04055 [Candidatus Aenigmarchaeota archaeon]|nr:hypothetical protein [Candidatus Aenigmarchaeota archaeon]
MPLKSPSGNALRTKTDDRLRYLSLKLEGTHNLGTSAHISPLIIVPLEDDLLDLPHYQRHTPLGYPKDLAEENGFRRIEKPREGKYGQTPLRIGKTDLHIREVGSEENLKSAAIVSIENTKEHLLGKDFPKGLAGEDFAGVFLHGNGVISGVYIPGGVPHALCSNWYPEDNNSLGKYPHPTRKKEVEEILNREFDLVQETTLGAAHKAVGFYRLPDMVMLATDIYKNAGRK